MEKEQKLRDEYYTWQRTSRPSPDARNFYPNRTNGEIADWWLEKVSQARADREKEIVGIVEGMKLKEVLIGHTWGKLYSSGMIEHKSELGQNEEAYNEAIDDVIETLKAKLQGK